MLLTFWRGQDLMNLESNPPRPGFGIVRRLRFITPFIMLLLTMTGCGLLKMSSSKPKAGVSSLQLTNSLSGPVSLDVLQKQIMRFADVYVATVAQACDDVTMATTNPATRLTVLRWKL